jgi:hypothetical protein
VFELYFKNGGVHFLVTYDLLAAKDKKAFTDDLKTIYHASDEESG